MPTFDTPEPISVEWGGGRVGDIRIDATDRTDTVVEGSSKRIPDDGRAWSSAA